MSSQPRLFLTHPTSIPHIDIPTSTPHPTSHLSPPHSHTFTPSPPHILIPLTPPLHTHLPSYSSHIIPSLTPLSPHPLPQLELERCSLLEETSAMKNKLTKTEKDLSEKNRRLGELTVASEREARSLREQLNEVSACLHVTYCCMADHWLPPQTSPMCLLDQLHQYPFSPLSFSLLPHLHHVQPNHILSQLYS